MSDAATYLYNFERKLADTANKILAKSLQGNAAPRKALYLKSTEPILIMTGECPVRRELSLTIDFNIRVEDQPVLRKLPTNG